MGAIGQEQGAQLEGQIHREESSCYDQTLKTGIRGTWPRQLVKPFGCTKRVLGIRRRRLGKQGNGMGASVQYRK